MLYIIGTPIGNLADMTLRAVETLKAVSFIIAENPGHTQKLLNHYEIKGKKLIQFADHNELKVLDGLVERLKTEDAALVSDAGTPGISDPGFRLVRACVAADIDVTPVPGSSAIISALSASGLPTDRFLFVGFLPKTEPKVGKILRQAKDTESTLVAYESPQRIIKTIELIHKLYPQAHLVIARELTKLHEEFIRGNSQEVLADLLSRSSIKGEITLLVSLKI
jgi:16S rRNA (cytidine1402-2'-O)-methyltransferase